MKSLRLLLAGLLCFSWSLSIAHDVKSGELYYNLRSDGTAEVTYKGKKIPDKGKAAYPKLSAVIVPETITVKGRIYTVSSIGPYTFCGCEKLIFVKFPGSITAIGNSAFLHCTNLKEIDFPDALSSIGINAFKNTALESVTIPASVKSVYAYAFSFCPYLKTVKLLSNKSETSFSVPAGLFYRCTSLTTFDSSRKITEYGKQAFLGCIKLGEADFSDCSQIGSEAFKECKSLSAVKFKPDILVSIGDNAFDGCTSISEVYLPKSLKTVGRNAFVGCSSLKDIYMSTKTQVSGSLFNGSDDVVYISNPVLGNAKVHFYENFTVSDYNKELKYTEVGRLSFTTANTTGKREDKKIEVCFYSNASAIIFVNYGVDYGMVIKTYNYVPSYQRIHFYGETESIELRVIASEVQMRFGNFVEYFDTQNKEEREKNAKVIASMAKAFELKETSDPEESDWDWLDWW